MGLIIPAEIEAVFQQADDPTLPLNEMHLPSEFARARQAVPADNRDQQVGAFAELAAWHFSRFEDGDDGSWGLYWGPMATRVMEDGSRMHAPDLIELDDDVLSHWIHRANSAKNAAIGARYADLAWTIGSYLRRPEEKRGECPSPQTAVDIPYSLALNAIDHYLAAIELGLAQDECIAWSYLSRAVELAVLLSNKEKINQARSALFAYHAKCSGLGERFMWWRLDQIVARFGKRLALSQVELDTLMDGLRKTLDDSSDPTKETFDPHAAGAAADRIVERLGNNKSEVQSIIKQAGIAFEKAAETARGLVATSWLEDLVPRYRKVGLEADAVRVERAVKARSAEAKSEMKRISVPIDISQEELNTYADKVAGSSMEQGLSGVVIAALAREDNIRKMVEEASTMAPLMSRIAVTIINDDGFTDAVIGSVEDDKGGRCIKQAADNFNLLAPLLNMLFQCVKDKHGITLDGLVSHIMKSPFFPASREKMLRFGLEAWLNDDPETAIHFLVPQVEAACRDLIEAAGVSVRKANHPNIGGSRVIGLGDVLVSSVFKEGNIKDAGFHLRALYTDPRGFNLRNKLCHGLATESILGRGVANLVVHSILMLADIRVTPKAVP